MIQTFSLNHLLLYLHLQFTILPGAGLEYAEMLKLKKR